MKITQYREPNFLKRVWNRLVPTWEDASFEVATRGEPLRFLRIRYWPLVGVALVVAYDVGLVVAVLLGARATPKLLLLEPALRWLVG